MKTKCNGNETVYCTNHSCKNNLEKIQMENKKLKEQLKTIPNVEKLQMENKKLNEQLLDSDKMSQLEAENKNLKKRDGGDDTDDIPSDTETDPESRPGGEAEPGNTEQSDENNLGDNLGGEDGEEPGAGEETGNEKMRNEKMITFSEKIANLELENENLKKQLESNENKNFSEKKAQILSIINR